MDFNENTALYNTVEIPDWSQSNVRTGVVLFMQACTDILEELVRMQIPETQLLGLILEGPVRPGHLHYETRRGESDAGGP